ncbi:hypothetical protein B0H34DRAFT_798609 [Crassisporium funariophilum]|nr:hypothetical protein B0H34DRAFT_798609 [Crassisporium funariophilum]
MQFKQIALLFIFTASIVHAQFNIGDKFTATWHVKKDRSGILDIGTQIVEDFGCIVVRHHKDGAVYPAVYAHAKPEDCARFEITTESAWSASAVDSKWSFKEL